MDLANEISKMAVRVTLSHHLKTPPLTTFRDNVEMKPDVKCLTESGVEFVDGSHQSYSVIFYCTGMYVDRVSRIYKLAPNACFSRIRVQIAN